MSSYMRNYIPHKSYRDQRAETVAFAILGLAGLLAIAQAFPVRFAATVTREPRMCSPRPHAMGLSRTMEL